MLLMQPKLICKHDFKIIKNKWLNLSFQHNDNLLGEKYFGYIFLNIRSKSNISKYVSSPKKEGSEVPKDFNK